MLFAGYVGCLLKLGDCLFEIGHHAFVRYREQLKDHLMVRLFFHRREIGYGHLPDWAALARVIFEAHRDSIEAFAVAHTLTSRRNPFGLSSMRLLLARFREQMDAYGDSDHSDYWGDSNSDDSFDSAGLDGYDDDDF